MSNIKRNLPTLEDVATHAGVSTATVSRCLNEPGKVNGKTRQRVMDAVEKLHYAPNFGARAIAANRTGTFGVVIPTMENAIFARGVEAFQQTLIANNATMLVASSSYDSDQEAALIRTLIARGADGLMLIGNERDPSVYEFLNAREIPVVIAWAKSVNLKQSYVGFDNLAASRKLVAEALDMGHRRVGYISAQSGMNDRARNRIEGARSAIKNAGIDPDTMHLIETRYSIQCGLEAMSELLKQPERPTLVVCGNDVLAVGAVQAAQAAGLDVPGDISIVGFDDIELATVVRPALTTVHVPHRDMGRLAAEALLGLVKDMSSPVQEELETYIVHRDSLAIPKDG